MFSKEERKLMREQAQANQRGLGAGMRNRSDRRLRLKYSKMVSDEYSHRIFPVSFFTPFNPYDLEDDSYNRESPYVYPYSASMGFTILKDAMSENPEVLKRVAEELGVKPEIFNLESESVSKEEFAAIKKWRMPKTFSSACFNTQFSDSRSQFGVRYIADCTLDDVGRVDESYQTGLFWDLYKIESECITRQVAKIRESYETGENSHRSAKDRDKDIEKVWDSRLISRPYWRYATRYMHIICDPQTYQPSDAVMKLWNDGSYSEMDCIKLSGYDFLELLARQIGTPRDVHMDYIEMEFQNPHIPASDEKKKGQYAEKVTKGQVPPSESITFILDSSEDRSRKILEDFDAKYKAYLDNKNQWSAKVMKDAVSDFKTISDDALLSKFQTDLSRYADVMSSSEMVRLFEAARIDTSRMVTDELLKGALSGDTKTSLNIMDSDREDKQKITVDEDEAVGAAADDSDFSMIMNQASASSGAVADDNDFMSALGDLVGGANA